MMASDIMASSYFNEFRLLHLTDILCPGAPGMKSAATRWFSGEWQFPPL